MLPEWRFRMHSAGAQPFPPFSTISRSGLQHISADAFLDTPRLSHV